MPDLKEKYSDSQLDPSEQDFDKIVSSPENRSFDNQVDADYSDQTGDSASEGNSSNPAESLKEAEENPSDQNPFGYEKTEAKGSRSNGNATRRRNGLVFGGVFSLFGLIALFGFLLLPLKIPAIMQMIEDEASQRIEYITEERAKVILGKYIITKATVRAGLPITGGGAVTTLIEAMRTDKFEKRLAAKGLTFESDSNGGVKLRVNNEIVGDGRSLKTDLDVVRAMDGNPITNKMLKEIIKEDIPSFRLMKQVKFARYLRDKYNIPKYGIENDDDPNEEERVKNMQEARLKTEYDYLANQMGKAVNCVLTVSSGCTVDGDDSSRPSDVKTSSDASAVGDSITDAVSETVESNTQGEEAQKTLVKAVTDKLGSKAIPIIGWIDLLATMDHITYQATEEDFFGKMAAYFRAAQYAHHYGTWLGYKSDIQLSAMDPNFIGVLAKQTEGLEEGQAYNYIQGNPEKGIPVVPIGANNESDYAKVLKNLESKTALLSNIPGFRESTHAVLNIYYETIGGGGFLGWASEKVGGFVAKITAALTPAQFEEWFGKIMGNLGEELFSTLGLDFDPTVKGGEWINATHGGATWTANDFCKTEMACQKLTPAQTAQQNSLIASERSEYKKQKGLLYALFSPENSTSVPSNIAIHTPTNIASFGHVLGSMVTDTPARILGMISPKSSATAYVDIHGVDAYGALREDLAKSVHPNALTGGPCEEFLCKTDVMMAESMLCEFEPESEGCAVDEISSTYTGEGGNVRVASFNMRGASHTNGSSNPTHHYKNRMVKSVEVMLGEHKGTGGKALEIIGFQEFQGVQRAEFNKQVGDIYNLTKQGDYHYTENPIGWNKSRFELVKEGNITGGMQYDNGRRLDVPWVLLKDKASGLTLYFLNTHDPANVWGPAADERLNNARVASEFIRNLKKENIPIIYTGDFNSRYDLSKSGQALNNKAENLTYCVLTKDGLVENAYDVWRKRPVKCPNSLENRDKAAMGPGIDHIYLTPGLEVPHMFGIPAGYANNGTDHPVIAADITIPGMGSSGGTAVGDWAWPLDEKHFKAHRADFLGSHYAGGGFTGGGSSSVDISWDSDEGLPVYSMLTGVVKKQPLGRESRQCTGNPNSSHNGGMMIESKVNGKVVQIAYAHGKNPKYKYGDTVQAGKEIMQLGNVGNSCAPHLHMDMSYGDKSICPQDVFLALEKKQSPELEKLVTKATSTCAGRL